MVIRRTRVHLQMFNVGKGIEKKIYSANKLYHRDHNGLLILAIHIVCRLNLYIFFTFGSLFVTKSESCCDPYMGAQSRRGNEKRRQNVVAVVEVKLKYPARVQVVCSI